MKLLARDGTQLLKRVTVKILTPHRKWMKHIYRAEPGTGIGPEKIESILTQVAENIDKNYPLTEYGMVEIGMGEFNFVPRKARIPEVNE